MPSEQRPADPSPVTTVDLPGWPDDPSLDPYRSGMVRDPGPLVRWLSRRFFDRIEGTPAQIEPVRQAAHEGSLVYVMHSYSMLDWLFFNDYLRKNDLPLSAFSNGISNLPFGPASGWLRHNLARLRNRLHTGSSLPDPLASGWLAQLVERRQAVLLFLKRRAFWGGTVQPRADLAEVLLDVQRRVDHPIYVVPQTLVWARKPGNADRTLLDALLGDEESPGRIRKAIHFFANYHRAVARVGEPMSLLDFLAENDGEPPERVAKKLRWVLLGYLYRERKVVKGPDVRPRSWILDRVIEAPPVRQAIGDVARQERKSAEAIEVRARKILDRMAADYKWTTILMLRRVIDFMVSRIYSGVELQPEDAERIRSAARAGTVLLLPSHRSHFDYLLLSWLYFKQGMMPPHIAAGVNLSFWPLGPVFRTGGAYFIRRSFIGDPLYEQLLTHYMRTLISEGYGQEFFIEGGRSRTGKMLPPKLGLLGIYADAMADRIVSDIQLVPCFVAYEKVVEQGAYTRELTGAVKKRESAGDLLKGASVLRKRFGKVYVRTNEPISLRGALELCDPPWQEMDRAQRKTFLERIAMHISAEIQDATVVTPSTVAALVLLTQRRRGTTRADFHERARFFARWLERRGAHFSDAWHFPDDALNEAVSMFESADLVQVVPSQAGDEGEDIVALSMDPGERMTLDYYKNGILFHFVPAALLLSALRMYGRSSEPLSALLERVQFLFDLFSQEFLFHPDLPAEHHVKDALEQLQALGIIGRATERGGEADVHDTHKGLEPALWLHSVEAWRQDVQVRVRPERSQLAGALVASVRSFYESYWVVLKASVVLREKPLPRKELLTSVMNASQRMHLIEDVSRPESGSKANLSNAIRRFEKLGVLEPLSPEDHGKDARLALHDDAWLRYSGPLKALLDNLI